MFLYIHIRNVKTLFILIVRRVKHLHVHNVAEGLGRTSAIDKLENIFYIVKLT